MKTAKKIVALLVSVIMVLAMGVSAFAATPTAGTLTVKSKGSASLKNQTIYLFKLFAYTAKAEDGKQGAYSVNESYKEALKEVLEVTTDDEYDLYSAIAALGDDNSKSVQDFANAFSKKVMNGGNVTGTQNTDYKIGKVGEDNTTTYQFQNVEPGYYLVYLGGSVEIQSSLVTVDGNVEVELKSDAPTPEKEAYDKDGETPAGSVQIGDVLMYKVKTKVPDISAYNSNTYKFTLKDTLSAGLDFVADAAGTAVTGTEMEVKVTVDGIDVEPALKAKLNGRTMTLDLADVVKNNQTSNIGKEIVVIYYAQVNEDAVIDNTQNSASLEYTNDPSTGETGESIPDVVKTPTFPLNVYKFEKGKDKDGAKEYLAGAKFQLHKETKNGTVIKMAAENNNGKYVVAKDQEAASVDTVVTVDTAIKDGYNLQINGLAEGTYYLVETEAPEGFNDAGAIKIVVTNTTQENDVTPSYTVTINEETAPVDGNVVPVENSRGTILPGTGGMGTVMFTVAGIALILGVGASFVISRKRKAA